jgi:hypothetical protein
MPLQAASSRPSAIAAILLASLLTAPAGAESVLLDSANLALLPPDTNSLMGVDVERLKGTSLYRFFEEQSRARESSSPGEIDEWAALTGFDPRRDVAELLIVSWQSPDQELRPGQALPFLAIARGQFDAAKMGQQFLAKGAIEEEYRGARVFLFPLDQPAPAPPDPGETIVIPPPVPEALPQIAIGFVGEDLAMVGGFDAIAAAIDRRSLGAPPVAAHEALLERGGELRDGHQIWAVSSQPAGLIRQGIPGSTGDTRLVEILESMSESTFAIDLSGGFRGRLAALCGAEDDARLLGDLARGFLAMARFSNGSGDPLTPVLDHVNVAENGSSIEVAVDIDGPQLDAYLESLKTAPSAVN